MKNNTYVLIRLKKLGAEGYELEVQVYKDTAGLLYKQPRPQGLLRFFKFKKAGRAEKALGSRLLHKFPVGKGRWGRLTVSGSKVLVLSDDVVHVYKQNGEFLRTFGKGELKRPRDITADNDGRVMVMDLHDSCVHLFTVEG